MQVNYDYSTNDIKFLPCMDLLCTVCIVYKLGYKSAWSDEVIVMLNRTAINLVSQCA